MDDDMSVTEKSDDEHTRTDITVIPETPSASEDDEGDTDTGSSIDWSSIPAVTHTATFKCIGCTKEIQYQEILARIAQVRNRG